MSDEIKQEDKAKAEQEFEELLKEKLQEQFNRGVKIGVMTVSRVVLEKLSNSSKPLMSRIEDVKRFCKVPFKGMGETNEQNKTEDAAMPESVNKNPDEVVTE